jgi:outer membrane receptor protein involved in Fe transport
MLGRFALVILAFALFPLPALAQGTTATIYGVVTDATGAVAPGVSITATNIATNFSRNAHTGANGQYQFQFLPIGTYKVEANAAGFKKFEQAGIVLDVNRNASVDIVLQVGAVSETIAVTADAPLVETRMPALGLTVNNQDIENLPMVDRDLYSLLNLVPGVEMTGEATDNFGAPMRVTLVNGSPNSGIGSVNYSLDGGSNMSGLRNTGNVAPNPDAVEQFRVITNSYSAEYGRFAGGVVDIVTKSGSNRIRGSLFEFVRNDDLNANRWLPGQSVLQKEPLHRNQFGGSVGGPVIKDRTFYFFSYSGLRQRTSIFSNTATPFTEAERAGDFSATLGNTLRDPLTGQPFPDRRIPVSRFDPVAKRITDEHVPLPNLGRGLYEAQIVRPRNSDDYTLKLDHVVNSTHRLTGSYLRHTGSDVTGLLGNLPWVSRDFNFQYNKFNIAETWIVSPSKINQFNIQYLRNFGGRVNLPGRSLGDFGSAFQIQGPPSLPEFVVSGRIDLASGIPGPVAGSNQYEIRDTLNINTGRHSISIGGQVVLEKMIHDTLLNNYGIFTFNTSNARGTGNATGDWFLGLPVSFRQDAPTTKINNSWYYGFFIQDDFRVNSRLTLNLGLRYDLQLPITDAFDRLLTFVPGVQSKVVPSAPLGLQFPGDPGIERGIVNADKNNFSPRIGIALDPFGDRKTAIRAGFGIFAGSSAGNPINQSSDNQPFAIRQTFNNVLSLTDPYGLLPGGVPPFPYSYTPAAPRFIPPSSIQGISLDYRWPYSYQMNFSVQRQVGADMSFTAAYVSTLVHRIPLSPDLNYPILTPGATANNRDSRRPYMPGTLASISMLNSILNSAYHGLQISGEKHYSRNFSLRGYYVFGKGLDVINTQNSTGQTATDWNNIALDRGRANNDRRHSFNLNGIWRLEYFRSAPAVVRAVAGGWSVSFVASMRSGAPLSISSGTDTNFDGVNDRADIIGDPVLDPNRPRSEVVAMWYSPAAFARPAPGSVGNSARNFLEGPGMKNVDMSIRRTFSISERTRLEFRADANNAFNIVNLSNPGTSINSSANVGRIASAGPMRQAQLGLKLTF